MNSVLLRLLKGFEKLSGASGWWMVVMEMIGEDYRRLSDFPPPYFHHEDIAGKLGCLH